ncbi:hypothetical protein N7462_000903 [Penicillium macrosclerotiorum]|uniref:uncharacterized protein n=1 Tax=Penicillium macrosclerotiorum TaxID=303699 RepID=UPI0025496D7C|nr:uncharacterized protein N7462_000903 [Penicillium macrosclerotiorum]KAJ5698898.1 hypothetical protein N7462_000903 [Penicillium macrosclerotiorum]
MAPFESLELIVHTEGAKKVQQFHGEHSELSAIFDFFAGNMVLKQEVKDPRDGQTTQHKIAIYFNKTNTAFVNLEALADNSLLLTFNLREIKTVEADIEANTRAEYKQAILGTTFMIRHQEYGFFVNKLYEGSLFKFIHEWAGDKKTLQLRLPQSRIDGWKTIALILLAYREISPRIWHHFVTSRKLGKITGFNWIETQEAETLAATDPGAWAALTMQTEDDSSDAAVQLPVAQSDRATGSVLQMLEEDRLGHTLGADDPGFLGH